MVRTCARVAAAVLWLGCGVGAPSDPLPTDLLGVWRTRAPAYRDRSFELRPEWVVFGTSKYTTDLHPIEHVRVTPAGSTTRVVIAYRTDDGAVLELPLEWTPGDPQRLRIGRRQDVWVPEARAHWLSEETS